MSRKAAEKTTAKRVVIEPGFDPMDPAEAAKREQRVTKYGAAVDTAEAAPALAAVLSRKRRTERFGSGGDSMDVDAAAPPLEPPPTAVPRLEAIHMHGVDVLDTAMILRYWAAFSPAYAEWINDSSCNVVFRDAVTAPRAIALLGLPTARTVGSLPSGLPPAPDQDAAVAASGDGLPSAPVADAAQWHAGPCAITAKGLRVAVTFRLATSADVKPAPGERARSRGLWMADADRPKAKRAKRRVAAAGDDDGWEFCAGDGADDPPQADIGADPVELLSIAARRARGLTTAGATVAAPVPVLPPPTVIEQVDEAEIEAAERAAAEAEHVAVAAAAERRAALMAGITAPR